MASNAWLRFDQGADPLAVRPRSAGYRAIQGEPAWLRLENVPPEGAAPGADAWASYVCQPLRDTGPVDLAHKVLMVVAFCAPQDRLSELESWYEQEHIGLLMKADGWLRARNYRVTAQTGPVPWTHIALHELRDIEVMNSPKREFARSTPWRAQLEAEAWFPRAGRWVYEPAAAAAGEPNLTIHPN